MREAFGPMSLVGLIFLGTALLWVMRVAYGLRRARSDDALRLVLNIAAWVMILIGLIGACLQLLLMLGPIGCVILLGILAMAVTRYRAQERRSLLATLAAAARRGIPLDEAAMSFAYERPDEMGLRAERLAELLRSGVALPTALQRSRTRLPLDSLLAVRLGTESGNLAAALRHVGRTADNDLDFLIRSMFEKYLYLGTLVVILVGMLTFMVLQVVPMFSFMFQAFSLELPAATELVITCSDWFAQFWFLPLPLLLGLVIFFILGGLYYIDLLPRDLPGLNWLSRRIDGANIMRALALATEQEWPISKTVWTLVRIYPKRNIRSKLQSAAERINSGEDWCDCLRSVSLIRSSEAAVLKAAQRCGNLQWALEEMADSALRRLAYQLRFWLHVLFPAVLVLTSGLIALIVIGLFMPLVSLIEGLT